MAVSSSIASQQSINLNKNNELINAKIVAMVVLGAISFIIGLIPLRLAKIKNIKSANGDKNLLISLLLCFGGGVLLFTTFIHLQPEVRENIKLLEDQHLLPNVGVPISELVFCVGFFLVYLIEELVHLFLHRKTHTEVLHRSLSVRCGNSKKLTIPRVTLSKFDEGQISYIGSSNKELFNSQSTISMEKSSQSSASSHSHYDSQLSNSFSGLLAVLALSFHAVFEGLAVGLEGSVQKVWYLFAAIATHKFVIAFCVGVELVTSQTKLMLTVLYIGTFAIVSPLGIGIGLILSETDQSQSDITSAILQGMAAGTLLYVVFFEVLSRERNNKHSGIWQLLAILAGFIVMYTLQMLTGHEHSHGEAGHSHSHHHHEHDDHMENLTQNLLKQIHHH